MSPLNDGVSCVLHNATMLPVSEHEWALTHTRAEALEFELKAKEWLSAMNKTHGYGYSACMTRVAEISGTPAEWNKVEPGR